MFLGEERTVELEEEEDVFAEEWDVCLCFACSERDDPELMPKYKQKNHILRRKNQKIIYKEQRQKSPIDISYLEFRFSKILMVEKLLWKYWNKIK